MFKLCITSDLGFEVWKGVSDFERYSVSTYGRVWDNKRNKECSQFLNSCGYKIVHLRDGSKDKKARVHRLVAIAFLPRLDSSFDQVNHKDEIKFTNINNKVENLEWCNNYYNETYGSVVERRTNSKAIHRVKQFSMQWQFIKEWDSVNDAAKSLGLDAKAIRTCCRGTTYSSQGYKWRYV